MIQKPNQDLITVDIGNQHLSLVWNNDFITETSSLIHQNPFNNLSIPSHLPVMISCVLDKPQIKEKYPHFHDWKSKHTGPIFYVNDFRNKFQFLSMPVQYASTLGEDRLIVAYGAFEKYLMAEDYENSFDFGIIFDAGSMLTLDFINAKQGFIGGYILPGIYHYKNSLGQGNQLKNYSLFQSMGELLQLPQLPHLPLDTKAAMELGYAESVLALVEKKILSHKNDHSKKGFILFTGGDSRFWHELCSKNLKHSITFMENKRFIHESLSLLPYKENR
ncbi:MAG: type III pantothenate kinase [Bacteriovoracaceae bacterium]|nr:type III pantothenate kinase [Bacteriovoracaceae bacterium]